MKKFGISLLCLLAAFVLQFTSCNVGLGEAVDTQPPELKITYPLPNKVIRESFVVEGTGKDETALASIKLSFNCTSSVIEDVTYEAVVNNSKNTWTCVVNEPDEQGKYPLIDGSYVLSVTAYDKAGRTSLQKLSLTIDNTAPLLILENPSTTDDTTQLNKFGSSLKVVGRVADSNDVDCLLFSVYDYETGELMKQTSSSNIAQNMEITLGSYSESDDSGFYNQIYKSSTGSRDLGNTHNYKFKVTVSDEARTYKGSSAVVDKNERGNTSEHYYLYNDVYTPVLKKYNINVKQLYTILNGTFGDETVIKNVLKDLMAYAIVSSEVDENPAKGTFSLNPFVNPYFTVNGVSALSDTLKFDEVSKSHVFTINTYKAVGEGAAPLDSSSYSLKLQQIDDKGKVVEGHDLVIFESLSAITEQYNSGAIDQDEFIAKVAKRSSIIDSENNQVTVSLSNYASQLENRKNYEICLDGKDEDGNTFNNEGKRFCFKIKSDGSVPTLKVTVPSELTAYIQKNNSYILEGTVSSLSSDNCMVYAYLNGEGIDKDGVEDKSDEGKAKRLYAKVKGSAESVLSANPIGESDVWQIEIPAERFKEATSNWTDSSIVTVKILAKDFGEEEGNSAKVDKTVFCDVVNPSCSISIPSAVTYDDAGYGFDTTEKYVNGTFEVSGTVTDDSSIESTELKVYKSSSKAGAYTELTEDEYKNVVKLAKSNNVKPAYSVDSTKFADNVYLKFKFEATDQAGNSNAEADDSFVVLVNQETDKPVISFSNTDKDLTDTSKIKADNNLFDQTGNNKIRGYVRDDDGLLSIMAYKIDAADYNGAETVWPSSVNYFWTKTGINNETSDLTVPLVNSSDKKSFAEGTYFIRILVCDINNKSNEYIFCVGVDSGAPVLFINKDNDAYGSRGNDFTVKGTVKDSSGTVKLYVSSESAFNEETATLIKTLNNTSAETAWDYTFRIAADDSGKKIYFIAIDKYENQTSADFTYKVDSDAPTLAADWTDSTYDDNKWRNTGVYPFNIPVSDSYLNGASVEGASGIKSVVLNITPKTGAASSENLAIGQNYNKTKYDNKYIYYTHTKVFDDGEYALQIVATDNANNSATLYSYPHFKVDSIAPVVGNTTAKLGNDAVSSINKSIITNLATTALVVSADVTDALSGISDVILYDGASVVDASNYTKTNSGSTYKFTLKAAALTTGNHSFKVSGIDAAGNEKTSAVSADIKVDATTPTVTVSGISPTVSEESNVYVNSYFVANGTANDETALGTTGKLRWSVNGTALSGTADLTGGTYSTWKTAAISTEALADGDYKLSVTAEDAAGNVSDTACVYPFKVKHSTDKPVVVVSNAESYNTSTSTGISAAGIDAQHNLFGTATNNKLNISITDDKGLKTPVTVKAYKVSDNTLADSVSLTISAKTSATTSYTLPSDEGKYKIVIEVEDQEYASAPDAAKVFHKNDSNLVYFVGVDAGNPKFAFTTDSGAYKAKASFNVSGTVEDSSGTVTVRRYNYVNKKDGAKASTPAYTKEISGTAVSKEWTDTIALADVSETGGNFYYEATDAYGNTTNLIFNYKIDEIVPTVAPDFSWTGGNDAWTNRTTYTYKIPVSDIWDKTNSKKYDEASGIQSVTILVKGDKDGDFVGSVMSLGSVYKGASGTVDSYCGGNYYTYTSTQALSDGGETKVKFTVLDNAGNSYNSDVLTYKIDSTAPEFGTVTGLAGGSDGITAAKYNDYSNNIYTITLPVTEAGSGVKSIVVDDNKKGLTLVNDINSAEAGYLITPAVTEGAISPTYTIKFTKAAVVTGQHTFNITVTDVAGNEAVYSQALSSDSTAPIIEVSGITPVYNSDDNTVNGEILIKGFVSDDAKLAALVAVEPATDPVTYSDGPVTWKLFKTSNLSSAVSSGVVSSVNGGISASWSVPLSTYSISDNTSYKFVIYAKDAAGNIESSDITFKVNQSTDKPVISLTGASDTITTEDQIIADANKSNIFAKSAKLTGLIEDDDGIASVVVTVKDSTGATVSANSKTYSPVSPATSLGTSYSLNHVLPDAEGVYTVSIVVTDTVGNATWGNNSSTFCIAVDSGAPVWKSFTPANGVYYNKDVEIEASLEDGSGSIKIQATTVPSGASSTTYSSANALTVTAGKGSFTDTISLGSLADNVAAGYKVIYTATDKWGQTSTREVSFFVDKTAPAFDDSSCKVGGIAKKTSIDEAWFKSEALTIEGSLIEVGSGVQSIYYWVKRNYDSVVTKDTNTNTANGSFAAKNAGGISTYKAAIDNIKDYIVSDDNNSNNPSWAVLYLMAEDGAGNKSVYSYKLKVDTTSPEIAGGSDSTYLTNKVNSITVTGTVSDNQSGINSVVLAVGSNNLNATVTGTNWSCTIPVEKIVTGNIYATATNNAGGSSRVIAGSIDVDETAPVVKLSESITSQTTGINGSKEVAGKVTESNPAKLELWYNKTATATSKATDALTTAGWTKFYETTDASEIYNFTTENADGNTYKKLLDFNTASGAKNVTAGTGSLYILPVVYDKAGNCSVHGASGTTVDFTRVATYATAFTVDLNTDRPVIKMNELEGASGTIRKYTTNITGMINDDDGIEEFYISPNAMANEAAWNTFITAYNEKSAAEKKKILEWTSNGSFMYTPEDSSDGDHNLYFYIKDKDNNVFFTGKTAASGADVYRPYILYKGAGSNTDNAAVVSYKTDSNPPTIEEAVYAYAPYTAGSTKASRSAGAYSEWSDSIPQSFVLGGSKKAYVKFRIVPHDALGVGSITGTLGGSVNLTFTKGAEVQKNGVGTGDYYYESDAVEMGNLSDFTTSSYSLNVIVKDISDLVVTMQRSISLDNTVPDVEVTKPSKTSMQTGEFTITGTSTDTNDVVSLKYFVMSDDYKDYTDAQLISAIEGISTQYNEGTPKAFDFTFDGKDDEHAGYRNPKFPATASELTNYSEYKRSSSDLYDIPVYFLAEDGLGNKLLKKDYTVYYNPYSDRPTITSIYSPGNNEEVSGMIRVSGGAQDNTAVGNVYIQLDINKDGNFDSTDMAYLLGKGYTVYAVSSIVNNATYATYKTNGTLVSLEKINGHDPQLEADSGFWGIKANGAESWYILVNNGTNLQDALNKDASDVIYHISVRAAAFDENNLLGAWSEKNTFKINPNAPGYGAAEVPHVAQFTDSTFATESSSIPYTTVSNSYVNGKWYLVTSVEHSSGVKSVTYSITDKDGNAVATDIAVVDDEGKPVTGIDGKAVALTGGYTGWKLIIPVTSTSGEGVNNLTITAAEAGQGKTSTATYAIRYDNAAPEIESLIANDKEWTADTKLMNSNNSLTIGATVNDGTAGMGKVLFYFYRDYGDVKRVYDVGMDIGNALSGYKYSFVKDGKTYAGIDASALESTAKNLGTSEKLYGASLTVTRPGTTSITLSADDIHIRKGSVVMLGNTWHKITNKTDLTLTIEPECSTEITSAFFPYAMSVDNFNQEKIKSFTTSGASITNDDGDGMWESIGGGDTSRQWQASIHANWIPDGPVTCVMFAFDKANNVSATSISCTLETSGPRLAKLHLGTDLNQNDSFQSNEFETYNFLGVEGEYQDEFALTTANYAEVIGGESAVSSRKAFKIKKNFAVIPEFVGGNGDIYTVFNNNDTTTTVDAKGVLQTAGIVKTKTKASADEYGANKLNPASGTISDTGKALDGLTYWKFTKDLGADSTSETDYKKMSFTFWDSTDGLVTGETSQKCFVSVRDILVMQTDTIAPNAVTENFYWNSASDNSLYQNSKNNGHIELENDLTAAIKTLYGSDPKVSGKIVLHGTAYDDTFLSQLSFSFTNFETTSTTTPLAFAVYDEDTNSWKASGSNTMASQYFEYVKVEDEYFGQNGHKVKWQVAIDTAHISDVALLDAVFTIIATDKKGLVSTASTGSASGTTDATLHKPAYQMDVVPYISGISTPLRSSSGLKDNNIRSANGKYSVLKGSTSDFIEVKGFNLKPTSARIFTEELKNSTDSTASSGVALTISTNNTTDYKSIKLKNDGTKSGYLEMFVNSVRTLNNINANDSKGSYTLSSSVSDYGNMPNREADYYNSKNVQLTDDRYIVFFDMHTAQTPTGKNTWGNLKNAYYPVMVMNGDNPVFGYMNGSGGPDINVGIASGTGAGSYRASHAMPQRAEFNGSTGAEVYTEYLIKASAWDGMGMAVDEGGRYYNVSCYNRDGAAMSLIYDRYAELYDSGKGWGAGTGYTDYNGNWAYEQSNNAITLDSMNYSTGVLLGRYMYPKLIAKGNSKTGNAKVYMAYYDDGTGEIAFRNFQLGTSGTKALDSSKKDSSGTTYNQKINFSENTKNSTTAAEGRLQAVANGSRYYSMGVTSDNHVVIVYYDETASALKLVYSNADVDGSSPTTAVAFTTSSVTFPSYVGTYCSMEVVGNAVHIAAFDASEADLKYLYLPSYNGTDFTSVTVDSVGSVGQWTSVKVNKEGKPYIAYYNSTETGTRESIKLAYLVGTTAAAGIDENGYTTGVWEYMTVPSITPPQGGDTKFQQVCLGFDTSDIPVLGYCAANLEFGKQLSE